MLQFIDVKKLVPDSVLTEDIITAAARNFNFKTLRVISTPQGEKVICVHSLL